MATARLRVVTTSALGRYCRKSLFALLMINSPSRRRGDLINVWGEASKSDELASDFGNWPGGSIPLVKLRNSALVALPVPARGAVITHHEYQVPRGNLGREDRGREDACRNSPQGRQRSRQKSRPCGGGGVVSADGRLWRTRAAVANDWPLSQWWLGLTGGQVQPMQDACEPASRRHPSTTRHAALEAGGFEMQIMPQGAG